MRHLTLEQLVDLVDDARIEPSMPHLQSCEACRAKLAEMRATLSAASEVEVPEPSPLFWDHLSARVQAAVEAERAGGTSMFGRWASWRAVPWRVGPLWVGGLAVVVVAVVIMTGGRVSKPPAPSGGIAVVAESQAELPALADDVSLSLVADLVTDLDWDSAVEAGLTTHIGVDDDVVTGLSDGERRELHALLRMELGEEKDKGQSQEKYKVQSRKYKVS
jgi:hypothetical protein